jgi:hydroxymethylglutaryl-CoA reductase (NADPH)
MQKIPYSKTNNYSEEIIKERQQFLETVSKKELKTINQYAINPTITSGNIENFIGFAQIPLGLAGPLKVNGEYAQGDFYIPMATTEGTLVASYNRGMKLTSLAGGIKTTILDDAMQRSPIFVFEDARYSKKFEAWIKANFEQIKAITDESSSIGKLRNIEQYAVGKMRWLRFNFSTGDAAGQNMVTKATHKACYWMLGNGIEGLEHFAMAANMDTDKKHSHLNTLHTRGKRVVAEITLPNEFLKEVMNTTGEALFKQRQYSNVGSMLSNSVNNGAHFANGLTAMFIATGQDVANIAESSAGIVHGELKPNGDYYYSCTIPSLIVATYGGGTGLPSQKECLEIMDCYGAGRVNKLAEIMAAVVLCGEISLGSAIVANEWVSSHEKYGRNR